MNTPPYVLECCVHQLNPRPGAVIQLALEVASSLEASVFNFVVSMLILKFPDKTHRVAYEEMVDEWRNFEAPKSPGKLFTGKNFDEFLSIIQREPTESDPAKVPAHLFFLADSESSRLLGAIQIRHHINHPNLIETGGHIGYGVRPSERRKGYATRMLALGIPEAQKIGLSRLLITCKDSNIGSWKVIESNGGVFERATLDEGEPARRYWIEIA